MSYNRMVLLTGEAPDAGANSAIGRIAQAVENVRGVFNEMAVTSNSSQSARRNDSNLTSNIKVRFVDERMFNPVHVQAVTESGVVYLRGMVTRKEADDETDIARTTLGVQKVVRLFEYLD